MRGGDKAGRQAGEEAMRQGGGGDRQMRARRSSGRRQKGGTNTNAGCVSSPFLVSFHLSPPPFILPCEFSPPFHRPLSPQAAADPGLGRLAVHPEAYDFVAALLHPKPRRRCRHRAPAPPSRWRRWRRGRPPSLPPRRWCLSREGSDDTRQRRRLSLRRHCHRG